MNSPADKDHPGIDLCLQEQKIGWLWLDEGRRLVFRFDVASIGYARAAPYWIDGENRAS